MEKVKNLKEVESAALSCVACGQCRNPMWASKGRFGVCPVYSTDITPKFEAFFARGKNMIIKSILWDDLPLSSEIANIFYQCTTCGSCEEFCHNSMNSEINFANHKWMKHVEVYEALRADLVEAGFAPKEHQEMNKALLEKDNPYGRDQVEKEDWTKDLNFTIKNASKESVEYLYFVGCTSALSPSTRVVAQSTAKILHKLDVDFGILGKEEICCGSVAKRTGNLKVFNSALEKNIKIFKEKNIKKIITSCAGCYRTFLKDYNKELDGIEVVHTSEFIQKYLKEHEVELKKLDIVTTYHDPCHLGRHCDFYDPPREILNQISELKEMQRIKGNALCCGAGGGVKKTYPELAMEISKNRIQDAEDTEATCLVSTCPFCHRNLMDGLEKTGSTLKMRDLTELIIESLKK
ncbi:MAG: (Fe-S)-binding protein [Candidatus Helarchaeota archaeon]